MRMVEEYIINLKNEIKSLLLKELEYQYIIMDPDTNEMALAITIVNHKEHLNVMKEFNDKMGRPFEFIEELCAGSLEGQRKALMYLISLS